MRKIEVNQYEYRIGNVVFSKVDKDGDIEIVKEDSDEYYGGDVRIVRMYINIKEMQQIIAWAQREGI